MKTLRVMALFLAHSTICAPLLGQPVTADDYLMAVADQPLRFRSLQLVKNDFKGDSSPYEVVVETWPAGHLTLDGDLFTYRPRAGFVGQDSFTYFLYSKGEATVSATVRLMVNAPKIPLAGDWNGDGNRDIGWFESSTATLFHCAAYDVQAGVVYFEKCKSLQLPPQTAGWTPLTLDWDGGAADEVAIYDPVSGTFYGLILRELQEANLVPLAAGLPGRIPVAGDWNGDGLDSVGLYDPAGARLSILRTLDDQAYEDYAFGPVCPSQNDLSPVAGDWDGDGIDTPGLLIEGYGVYVTDNPALNQPEKKAPFTWTAGAIAGPWGSDHIAVYDPSTHTAVLLTQWESTNTGHSSGIPTGWPTDPEDPFSGCGGNDS